jgi:hypothetical protein
MGTCDDLFEAVPSAFDITLLLSEVADEARGACCLLAVVSALP